MERGTNLSALVWGDADPELVLIHGGAQNAHTWDTVALALGRPALAIDLPGHGHSGWRDDGLYTPQNLAEYPPHHEMRRYFSDFADHFDLRKDYLELVGHPLVPPRKMFGLWVSEYGYDDWAELEDKIRTLHANNFPVDGAVLEPKHLTLIHYSPFIGFKGVHTG